MTRRKRYSAEFKREALRRAERSRRHRCTGGRRTGDQCPDASYWRDAAKRDGEKAFPGQGTARDQELMRLKRKLAKVEQERDFLKEAAAYFARESK